ncbi:polysaccharide biosynthesis/export family protein [Thalassotalea sediminis]|uniref:polysaccharide biosynthesis/export family protein n=1 Tax=Thalassotalea sediminis TaxID=1759089 RepID=UPI002573DA80|nr:polysaccharide biosynthesis/export family protein [Thalassotalea sediminis]
MRFLVVLLLIYTSFANASDYQLGSGDSIAITVYNEPDLTTKVRINKSGKITFPFLNELHVHGLTTKQLALKIKKGLLGDYLINPQVSVSIVEYRPFFIHGQVKMPGGYPFQDDLTLDKAIAIAGGLAARASKTQWKITRVVNGKTVLLNADVATLILPDDIIEIEQSFF